MKDRLELLRSFITQDSVDSLVVERYPDFVEYLFFHNVLDKFCWLIKLHYADRITVRKKGYRIDTLFQSYILNNGVTTEKIRKRVSDKADKNLLQFHLAKGWHNELVRSDPLHPDYLDVGTNLSDWGAPGSGGFAAWNIIQSYYAVFEFISCLCLSADPSVDTRGHKKVAATFTSQVQGKFKNRIIFYPFSLSSISKSKDFPEHPRHCDYHYASYPRDKNLQILDLEVESVRALSFLSGTAKKSFFDLLYELRLWANYTGLQSLLKLSDGGYQKFLSKNLAIITFFAAGMAELATLSAVGRSEYLAILREFSESYIEKHARFARNRFLVPAYIRLRSYAHLGLIDGPIDFILPRSMDPIQFIKLPR